MGDAVVQTPLGWSAVLEEGSFSVTAPIRTRSTPIADSDTDVVIVAQSASGRYISVSKVRVSLSDAEIDLDPRAAVTPDGVPTATTLGFLVTLEEATSYKYILRKNREAVPAYDEVKRAVSSPPNPGCFWKGLIRGPAIRSISSPAMGIFMLRNW